MPKSIEISPYKESIESEKIYLPSNVSLHIFFSSHMDREDLGDFSEFRRKLRRSDIYISEGCGWDPMTKLRLKAISSGQREVYQALRKDLTDASSLENTFSSWDIAICDALYASNRIIDLVDVPSNHPLARQVQPRIGSASLLSGSFDEAIEKYESVFEQPLSAQRLRDTYMLENIGPTLDRAILENPRLKSKQLISVFMTLGELHLPVYDVLAEKAKKQRDKTGALLPNVSVEVAGEGYDPTSIIFKHLDTTSDFSLTKEEKKIVLAQGITLEIIRRMTSGPVKAKVLCQTLTELTMEEMTQIFNFAKDALSTKNANLELPSALFKFDTIYKARAKG